MNKDFALKIRLSNILWSLGYYTRLEVKLAEYGSTRGIPLELTDLDVLGIRISPDFVFDYIVADCTSNKDVIKSPIQRAFWLKGVMDLFGSSRGYLAVDTRNSIPESQRRVSAKLGVTILNEENLCNLEKRTLDSDTGKLKLGQAGSWLYHERNLATLRKELDPLLRFRKHDYWINEHYQNIVTILTALPKYNNLMEENNRFHKALVIDLMSLLSLSLLHMGRFVFQTNPENAKQELRAYVYGGYRELKMREGIVQNIRKLVESSQQQRSLFDSDIKLDPEYLPRLFDLVFRWINKPADAAQILRYLQVVLFEKTLHNQGNPQGMETIEKGFSDITKKFVKDLAFLIIGIKGLSETMAVDVL